MDVIIQMIAAAMSSGTPLLFAVLGGILIERSGIIQLGAEGIDRKSTRLNSSHIQKSRMPSSA